MTKKITVGDVCDFYEQNHRTTDFNRYWPRIKRLKQVLGGVPMDELRRKQIWDCFSDKEWSYLRDSLEAVKRVFSYAVKPRVERNCETLSPLLSPFDNPLDGVVVNLKRDSACWKAQTMPPELRYEMVDRSEAAWEAAHAKKMALEGKRDD